MNLSFFFPKPTIHRLRFQVSLNRLTVWSLYFISVIILVFLLLPSSPPTSPNDSICQSQTANWGWTSRLQIRVDLGGWERRVRSSARVRSRSGLTVLVTGAADFVGSHVSISLKQRDNDVVGLDNFNSYYDVGLKKSCRNLLNRSGVFIGEGDINDHLLLQKPFDVVAFTHVMHLAAQAGVRYAMLNPNSYIHSNVVGLVSLLDVCKSADPLIVSRDANHDA